MLFNECDGFCVGGAQAILVDDRNQPFQPLLPAFLGHIIVDPLAQLARMGRHVQTFGLLLKDLAEQSSCHYGFIAGAPAGHANVDCKMNIVMTVCRVSLLLIMPYSTCPNRSASPKS